MDLAAALERNHAEHAAHLLRGTAGTWVDEPGDVLVADSGITDDTFNMVIDARFTEDTADDRIAEVIASLPEGRPFSWWVGPNSRPTDLSERLAKAGFPADDEEENAMWFPLSETHDPQDTDLEIVKVRTEEQLADFAGVLAPLWTPPSKTVPEFYRMVAAKAVLPDCPARFFVGYRDGRPVATAEVFLAADVAGIYNVATAVEHRRRGYAAALTSAVLAEAAGAGYRAAVLQASEAGELVYRGLGFREFGKVREHALA
ncbi:GNAT family N-acetyltransferase [Allokutzneria sp. A3M-2-11 16]|uniref:GNAT family N-acetyltransferase n=1 Tax=Allokutzneria sp. A3M-2-11 16 TaxID=2962043 RepID=UPI0020B6CABF|nr:GNAT family N-acetyltransferase [Allokutzneria sp. A3M-2-11 16]MCP3802688.1 GNAT family N-acetyltransferase [Allokutzneria sp. A3M-2-11 16]